jgi:hypothetical protein
VEVENLIHRVFGSKTDSASSPADATAAKVKQYRETKGSTQTFLASQKEQALTKLSSIIQDASLPFEQRLDATRTLGQLIGRRLHNERNEGKNPVDSAIEFLKTHPKLVLKE